jgi:hypothetical protein
MVKYTQGIKISQNVTTDGLSVENNLNKNPDKLEELQKVMITTPSLAKNSPENILSKNLSKYLLYLIGIHGIKYGFRVSAYNAPDDI